ncbi:MAG: DUF1559 domain-containing protein [Planctomycetota bacterium]|nr:DUF1559 domain-containing protein [Planctomycetota bacterium]
MFLRRKGFTLVELLVVIFIIGILVSLLLPAVQAARESSRRCSCCNHLNQIGVAAHMHHNTYGHLPAGWSGYNSGGQPLSLGDPGWGWAARVLPFIEQSNVEKNLIDFEKAVIDSANDAARLYHLSTFRCPSDSGQDRFLNLDEETGTGSFEFATANYVGVWGTTGGADGIHTCAALPAGQSCLSDGCFFHNSRVRFADILDGLSQTFMVGERSSRRDFSTWVGSEPANDCAPGRIVGTAIYSPNWPQSHTHDFSSEHPSGTHFLLADGSVRLVPETIDIAVYRALVTRSGSETVSAPP